MPFDGSEFSRSVALKLPAPAAPPSRLQRGLAWLRVAFLPGPAPESPDFSAGQLLRMARAMIEPEGKWIRGRYRMSGGRHCAVGALRAAGRRAGHGTVRKAHGLLRDVARGRGFESVEKMNDCSTHEQVLAAFDSAIAVAEGFTVAER